MLFGFHFDLIYLHTWTRAIGLLLDANLKKYHYVRILEEKVHLTCIHCIEATTILVLYSHMISLLSFVCRRLVVVTTHRLGMPRPRPRRAR